MDPPYRAESSQNTLVTKMRLGEREKPEDKAKTPTHRGTRYKEKFQTLRDKYDQVTAINDEYQRDLEAANSRIKKLQAENDLLLDAMNLAIPSQPALFQYIVPHPVQHSHGSRGTASDGPAHNNHGNNGTSHTINPRDGLSPHPPTNGHTNGFAHPPETTDSSQHALATREAAVITNGRVP